MLRVFNLSESKRPNFQNGPFVIFDRIFSNGKNEGQTLSYRRVKQQILDYLQGRFNTFGLGAGTTFSEIVFATKIKRELVEPLLFELLAEKR